ncbi:methyltransferase domain-containing protein [Lentimicrobium sp. L6]|uniref:class I SAM-dependent methyltransferase n=1 Tax=Lentimicrobium sp. L6 TaxID=2735916 RepID=UPI001557CF31|nr:class I SAM-dependent methyltransferase [Lentimicrobium sp. L6]NPD84793.1 methyltransferase domain-containing protein [Lentimicrobium sp. L6]
MGKIVKAVDDIMGQALMEEHLHKNNVPLIVRTSVSDDEEYETAYFFRNFDEMPELEQKAIQLSKGKVLDVGAGTGIHALALQKLGFECHAIDISELSVQIMEERGVKHALCQDFFELKDHKYDTILLLMNGIGLVENFDGFKEFFSQCKNLLNEGGQILFDSSDLIYLFEEEDGSFMIDLNDHYYGEVEFQVEYQGIPSKPFPWLFIDFDNLQNLAERHGFQAELLQRGAHYDYLARITLNLDL